MASGAGARGRFGEKTNARHYILSSLNTAKVSVRVTVGGDWTPTVKHMARIACDKCEVLVVIGGQQSSIGPGSHVMNVHLGSGVACN